MNSVANSIVLAPFMNSEDMFRMKGVIIASTPASRPVRSP